MTTNHNFIVIILLFRYPFIAFCKYMVILPHFTLVCEENLLFVYKKSLFLSLSSIDLRPRICYDMDTTNSKQ